MAKLINLDTGDVIDADPYSLMERGLPSGYRVSDSITTDEWIELYCNLFNQEKQITFHPALTNEDIDREMGGYTGGYSSEPKSRY